VSSNVSTNDEVVVIAFIRTRAGVDPSRFADWAASTDLPTWRKKDVVLGFDTYRVTDSGASGVDADFVEVMHLRSWEEWVEVGRTDPEIAPLATAFDELVDDADVRRIRLLPVDAG
jgi:hypothetical protein